MWKAYKPVLVEDANEFRAGVDHTLDEFASTMGYGAAQYAGYRVELMRINLHRDFPGLYDIFRRLDRRLCLLNNATVFEFVL